MQGSDSRPDRVGFRSGFTLLEALISIAVFSVVLIAILEIYDSNQRTFVRGEAKVDVQQNVRVALGQIAHDIRLAGYDPTNSINSQTVKYPLQPVPGTSSSDSLSTSQLWLIGDVDGDGVTDCVGYLLSSYSPATYANNGSEVKQIIQRKKSWSSGVCNSTMTGYTDSVIADNIRTLTFTYYSATGGAGNATPSSPSQTRRVTVQITGLSQGSAGMEFTGETEVVLRQ